MAKSQSASLVMHEAGAVEQHVDRAVPRRRVAHRGVVQHVEPLDRRPELLQLQRLGQVLIGGDHARPLGDEGFRRGAADALRRRRQKADLALEPSGHAILLRSAHPCRKRGGAKGEGR
jgi:hypothetical protein